MFWYLIGRPLNSAAASATQLLSRKLIVCCRSQPDSLAQRRDRVRIAGCGHSSRRTNTHASPRSIKEKEYALHHCSHLGCLMAFGFGHLVHFGRLYSCPVSHCGSGDSDTDHSRSPPVTKPGSLSRLVRDEPTSQNGARWSTKLDLDGGVKGAICVSQHDVNAS